MNKLDLSTQSTSAKHVSTSPILYPDERLVALIARWKNKIQLEQIKYLDIGFGSGRHLQLGINNNFDSYGIEYTNEAIAQTKNILGDQELLKELWLGDYRNFDFPIKFDAIVAWGLICHSEFTKMKDDISTMLNLINNNGSLFLNFRTKDNWFNGLGEIVSNNTYLIDNRGKTYDGYLYTFIDIEELNIIVSECNARIEQIERIDLWKNNLSEQNSWFVCELSRQK